MVGNVWEWTSSMEKVYPYRAEDGREGFASNAHRVLRGGSFGYDATIARCATRRGCDPTTRYDSLGFRVGWSPHSQEP